MSDATGRLFILGAGGHGKVVADAASLAGQWRDVVFLDDRFPTLTRCEGWHVVGAFADLAAQATAQDQALVALGSGVVRQELIATIEATGIALATVVHPQASVSTRCEIGAGTVALAGSTVAISTRIGKGCILNTRASVDHDGVVGDYCHVSPGAHIGGTVTIGAQCWIGIGAAVANNVTLGDSVIVGAGAAVIGDVDSNTTVVGVPARALDKTEAPRS